MAESCVGDRWILTSESRTLIFIRKLISLMLLGYRTEAISILGHEVMQPRGLIGLGKDSIDYARNEFRQIFEVMADVGNYPLMIHCTQGKDRTGLIVLLLILLLNVPVEAAFADYLASERELLSERKSRIKEINDMGLGDDFAGCPTEFVTEIHDHINRTYGSVQGYLNRLGVDKEKQHRIVQKMLLK